MCPLVMEKARNSMLKFILHATARLREIKLLIGSTVNLLFLHHGKSQFKYGWRIAECGGKGV